MSATTEKVLNPVSSSTRMFRKSNFFAKSEEHSFFGSSINQGNTFFNSSTGHVQTKLSVSQPEDPQEKEADSMADKVMSMPEPIAASANEDKKEEGLHAKGDDVQAKFVPAVQLMDISHASLNRTEEKEQEVQKQDEEQESVQAKPLIFRTSDENHNEDKLSRKADDEEKVNTKLFRAANTADENEEGKLQAKCNCGGEEKDKAISRKTENVLRSSKIQLTNKGPPAGESNTFESKLSGSKGMGSSLPDGTRQYMENRFGADFGSVRVHTDNNAEIMSRDIHAQAFTHGGDIYFNSGKYSPNTSDGAFLLAHELTHTIQQGSSKPSVSSGTTSVSASINKSSISKKKIQRTAQLDAAVNKAKAEIGKVNANKEGADGFRVGWPRLLEYFKTTFGENMIVNGSAGGAGYKTGTISEQDIKKQRKAMGMVPNQVSPDPKNQKLRDAMPSWCGIFVFWALNKGGIPMPKWKLGGNMIDLKAAYPKNYTPKAGDIAYRSSFSHYAIVEKSVGTGSSAQITTINGNTTGNDNLGGQIQSATHPPSGWTGFFNPILLKTGELRNVGDGEPDEQKTKSLRELRRELFGVDRKSENENREDEQKERDVKEYEDEVKEPVVKVSGKTEESANADTENKLNNKTQDNIGDKDKLQKKEDEEQQNDEQNKVSGKLYKFDDSGSINVNTKIIARAEDKTSSEKLQADRLASNTNLNSAGIPDSNVLSANPAVSSARGPPLSRSILANSINSLNGVLSGKLIQRSWLGDAWDSVTGFVSEAAEWVEKGLDAAKRWLLGRVRDFVRNIPGYSMLSFILGEDPITGEPVVRNGRNLLNAGLDLLPAGFMFRSLMQRLGIFDDVANWLNVRISDLEAVASGIGARFSRFWDSLSLSDVGDPEGVFRRVADLLSSTIQDIVGFVERSASEFLEMVKRVIIREVSDFVRSRIPRLYPLLKVLLGFDPVTNEPVARNGTNILNAFLEISEDGREQRRQMTDTGTFQKIAAWIDRGIAVFSRAYQMLRQAFVNIWDYVTIENLFHPIDTFTRIYNEFSAPVILVGRFIIDAAIEILRVIKDALLRRLRDYARTVRGYPLICVLIGKDPFTNERVPRTIQNIIRGFMSLMDGGEEQYNQLQQSGAIEQTVARIEAAVSRLNLTPASIARLFINLWNSFSIRDLIHPFEAFARIIATFAQPIRRLIAFVVEIIKIVVEIILKIMNFPVDLVQNIITRALAAFERIKRDPIGFLKNLLRAIKQGFIQFFDNIVTHLINGVVGWLLSELRDANVPAPQDFSLRGIISWVLQVLGLSMEAIWQKLAQHPRIGPERVARIRSMINTLEGIWTFIKDVQERGIVAIWDRIQEQLSNLWNIVLDAVKNWIMERIIAQVTAKLLSMLDPTGIMAVINSAIAIYRAVQSFIRYLRQMLEVINSFVNGVADIAEGNVATAANYLENTMDRAMPIVIGFLANQVGLGGIGRRISEIIASVREMVDRALTWLVNKAVDTGFALIDRVTALGRRAIAAVRDWWSTRQPLQTRDGQSHTLYFSGSGANSRIMISTTPMNYNDYLDSLKTQNNLTDDQLGPARAKAAEIDTEKQRVVPEEQKLQQSEIIVRLINDLVTITSGLPIPASAGINTEPVYGPPMEGGFGTSASVALRKAPHNLGSEPSVANSQAYNDINIRKQGSGAYYVKGHLLNDNLGGPGTTWSNLTPLTVAANADHKTTFENPVKIAVNGTAARGANPTTPKGYMKDFSVRAVYGRSAAPALAILEDTESEDMPAGYRPDMDVNDLIKILRAEMYVPTSLSCSAVIKEENGTAESTVTVPISNDIQYGILAQYSLNPTPKQDFILADHINFSAPNPNEAVRGLLLLNQIGQARALRIYNAFMSYGRITDYKANIGITKKVIEKNNQRYRIISGNKP